MRRTPARSSELPVEPGTDDGQVEAPPASWIPPADRALHRWGFRDTRGVMIGSDGICKRTPIGFG